jgi:hypothetical protein
VQVIGLQFGSPHTPVTPRPPHVAGAAQAPQSRVLPQPSPMTPQKRDAAALQVIGTHPDATHSPEPLQVCAAAQAPQFRARPQPSPTLPQYFAAAPLAWQASGAQLAPPTQTPIWQVWSPGQAPQSSMPKQPFPITPQ